MAKIVVRLALIFLLFAISRAQNDAVSIEEHAEPIETTTFEQNLDGNDKTVPLTLISFRPVNRHFQRGKFPLTFRRGRRCGHWGRRSDDRLSYGNDMILSNGRDRAMGHGGFDPELHGDRVVVHQLRPMEHEDEFEMPRHHHRHHHHHHHHDTDDEFDHHHHDHENVFLKNFRKFLGQF